MARSRASLAPVRSHGLVALVVCIVVAMTAGQAGAHPLDVGYLRMERTGEGVAVVFEVEAPTLAHVVGKTPETLDVEHHAAELAAATYRLAPIIADTGACEWTSTTAEIRPGTATVVQLGNARCPRGMRSLRWDLPIVERLLPTFELLVKAYVFSDHVTSLRKGSTLLSLGGGHGDRGLLDIVLSGVHHIGATPSEWHGGRGWKFPEGIDHILFLLALILRGGSLRRLLGIVTGFTVGHSVTLALATFGVLRIPQGIVEPLVALTIAITAVEVFVGKFERHRWKLAMGFGLIHGFAFANAIIGLQLSGGHAVLALLAFNGGVEIGQILIIALVAPLIVAMHKYRPAEAVWVVRAAATGIFIAAIYWFVQRL
jgi:hypothetical protein